MLAIGKGNKNNIIIQGDFWDFDRLYFAISKFTGDYGIDSTCPFPGYEAICESLLGLCYEIRKAQEGKRELYEQYNGIPEDWFRKESPVDKENDDINVPDDDFDNPEEDDSNFSDDDFDFNARFSRENHPNTTTTNTLLQFQIPFSEALYYALIFRELLEKKDLFLEYRKNIAKDKSHDMQELNIEYYYCQARTDLARIIVYMESTFRTLFHLIGKDTYIRYMNLFSAKTDGFLGCDIIACNKLVVEYGVEASDSGSSKNVTGYLDKLYLELCR